MQHQPLCRPKVRNALLPQKETNKQLLSLLMLNIPDFIKFVFIYFHVENVFIDIFKSLYYCIPSIDCIVWTSKFSYCIYPRYGLINQGFTLKFEKTCLRFARSQNCWARLSLGD